MYYVTDENKNQVDLNSVISSAEMEFVDAAGLTLTIDGIECYGISGKVCKITDDNGVSFYQGVGDAIFADKNHDLSYYSTGSDYVDEAEPSSVINNANKYGYEWGGHGTSTGINAAAIGSGLDNTNNLIQRGLAPSSSGWYIVWDKIKEFRETRSSLWFLPSKEELDLVYEARSNLNNLSTSTMPYYWSSSEAQKSSWGSSENQNVYAYVQFFDNGLSSFSNKRDHYSRARLCVQY